MKNPKWLRGKRVKYVKFARRMPARQAVNLYKCFCGNLFEARQSDVIGGHTRSCGCYAKYVRGQNIIKANKQSTKS